MLLNRAVQTRRAFLPGYVSGRILALAILTCVAIPPVSLAATLPVSESTSAEQRMKEGLRLVQRGDFEQATLSWREAARLYEAEQKFSQQSSALIHLAQAYQALGQYRDAVQSLESALSLAEKSNDKTQVAIALASLGNVYIATGPSEMARKYLDEGLRVARELKNDDVSAIILNNLGNLLTQQKKIPRSPRRL
jgi:tetratricopeptide (TPR) repeat protein